MVKKLRFHPLAAVVSEDVLEQAGNLTTDKHWQKTIQRFHETENLVIAPTSVCLNWISEAERFAPTLRIRQLGNGDRQKLVKDLQPFDLLICSYGLLQQEDVIQLLAKVQWETPGKHQLRRSPRLLMVER